MPNVGCGVAEKNDEGKRTQQSTESDDNTDGNVED